MDNYFIDPQRRRAIKVLFSNHPLTVNSESFGLRNQLKYNVVVEKMDLVNLIVGHSGSAKFYEYDDGFNLTLIVSANPADRV